LIPYKIKFIIAGISVFLLMIPSSSIFASDLITREPNTIPLWGPTWCQTEITYRIDNADKITPAALTELKAGIQSWVDHTPAGFTITEVNAGDPADIVIKFKKGGGKVQGQARQQNDNGCFTRVSINVSGKAFGVDAPMGQVQSISAQEFGHGLGMLHSNNNQDVMFGNLQSPPNIQLSFCDITAWEAVMEWLISGSTHSPTVSSVSCGTSTPPPPPSPDGTPTALDITHGPHNNPTLKAGGDYQNRNIVHIFVAVTDDTDNGVSGVNVHVEIDAPKSDLSGDTTTDDSGIAHIHYKVNSGRDGKGIYHISSTVTSASISCDEADACHADFSVV